MKIRLTLPAEKDIDALPDKIQKRVFKQFDILLSNIRHPSLRAKKYDESRDIWQCRINKAYRFYFQIVGDTYIILALTEHPK